MEFEFLDDRPFIVAIAGSNGAGKTTFFHSHLAKSGLRYVNADDLSKELQLSPYDAAELAARLRETLVARQESFIFETVLSDPVGEKISFLRDAAQQGYEVVLIFIRIENVDLSIERVSKRVAQGGHDVPDEKLKSRFKRTLKNLAKAIEQLPRVIIFDNSDMSHPFRLEATYIDGKRA